MANGRTSMRNIFEFFRLHWDLKLSQEKSAAGSGVSKGLGWHLIRKARALGLIDWDHIKAQSPEELEDLLYGRAEPVTFKIQPDWTKVLSELRRRHVTRELLWNEYREEFGTEETLQLSQFCASLSRKAKTSDLAMRQNHIPGEKGFFDFAGSTITMSPLDAPSFQAHLFVSALGASSLTYVKAFANETRKSWIEGQISAFEYYGGVPKLLVPDNPKALVLKADRYEPTIAREYLDLAAHYGAAVCPARVRKPKDKARVEAAVGLASRWIIAVLRNRTFTNLEDLNFHIAELLEVINNKPFRKLKGSRRSVFEDIERPALLPLPVEKFEPGDWQYQHAGADYTVELYETRYSVPSEFRNSTVRLRWTETMLEVFSEEKRIAVHARQDNVREPIMVKEHRHPKHRSYAEWGPEEALAKAAEYGSETKKLAEAIILQRPHPEIALKALSGLLKLASRQEPGMMERAAPECLRLGIHVIKEVNSVLSAIKYRDKIKLHSRTNNPATQEVHENIRGPKNYEIH
jgi:transposase